ncbi:Dimeric alpha-beta barrel [Pyrenophora seminiperda CCB06]|uniref:Dimeric alpha-beta barrel n=1 Tax=Pyrenophora seminiperda CCB06 TaxID=1302712 RepID=A0A3M7M8C6_9PLEO|nr:Dimeric alpha-beta barrel [Pyrenophora seminiperda CCB06]
MAAILTIARILFKSKEARQKAIDAFHNIIEYTKANEPEVLQYVCALPIDDSLGNEIYMIEEYWCLLKLYTNQAANDAHFVTKPVQDLVQLFTTGDVLAQPPEVHSCFIVTEKTSKSPVPVLNKPAIVLMSFPSKLDGAFRSNGVWKKDTAETLITQAKGISFFAVVEDKDANSIRVQCVAEDWNSFASFQTSVLDDSAGHVETVKIRPIDGFLGREGRYKL